MDVREGDRAQSVQVGVIFLFGFLIVGLSVYQVAVVPEQNRQVEFNAYQQAAADLTDVRNDVLATAERDTTLGTTVKTGVQYPSRAIFVNPGPPPNRIATTGERNVSIENVEAVDAEADNARAFVANNVSDRSYATRDVRYDPNYNVLNAQPMVVTGQQAYRVAGDRPIPLASQTLIGGEEGERIHLTTIDGDLSAGGSTVPVTSDSVSASTRATTIRSADGGDITLRLETPAGLSADGWIDRTGRDLNGTYARVLNVENATTGGGPERVAVTLAGGGGRSYQLRLSRVEVRSANAASTVEDPEPAYITSRGEGYRTVSAGQRTAVSTRVRDEFTNPVEGATVRFNVTRSNATLVDANGQSLGTTHEVTTTAEGTASVRVDTAGVTEDVRVNATAVDATSEFDSTTAEIQILETGTPAPGEQASASITTGSPSISGDSVTVPLENPTGESATIEALGFNFYFLEQAPGGGPPGGGGGGNNRDVSSATLASTGQTFQIPGPIDPLDQEIAVPATGTDVTFQFDDTPREGDFFVITVQFADGVTRTFFVGL
jgi:hypothetical protein